MTFKPGDILYRVKIGSNGKLVLRIVTVVHITEMFCVKKNNIKKWYTPEYIYANYYASKKEAIEAYRKEHLAIIEHSNRILRILEEYKIIVDSNK